VLFEEPSVLGFMRIFGKRSRGDVELLCDGIVHLPDLEQIYYSQHTTIEKNLMTLTQQLLGNNSQLPSSDIEERSDWMRFRRKRALPE
jgi:hypothetical protein